MDSRQGRYIWANSTTIKFDAVGGSFDAVWGSFDAVGGSLEEVEYSSFYTFIFMYLFLFNLFVILSFSYRFVKINYVKM